MSVGLVMIILPTNAAVLAVMPKICPLFCS